jgi:hypothetical protein
VHQNLIFLSLQICNKFLFTLLTLLFYSSLFISVPVSVSLPVFFLTIFSLCKLFFFPSNFTCLNSYMLFYLIFNIDSFWFLHYNLPLSVASFLFFAVLFLSASPSFFFDCNAMFKNKFRKIKFSFLPLL